MPQRLYSTYQVADLLGASAATVNEWLENGWLTSERAGDGPVRISEEGLIRFLKQRGADVETVMAKAVLAEGRDDRDAAAPPDQGDYQAVPEDTAAVDPLTQIVQAVLRDSVKRGASHIHLEPVPDGLTLRLRIDGALYEKVNFKLRLPRTITPKLISRFKQLAELDVADSGRPQTGRFSQLLDGREINFSASTCPTIHGEKVVIRLADREESGPGLSQLGLSDRDEAMVRIALSEPCGLILVTGRPGSGRSTTLRAMLEVLNDRLCSIVAVEKRAGRRIEGVTHCRVDPANDFGFAEAMLTLDSQDADVVLLGDIPEPSAAAAVLESAGSGKMILATMNTRSTADAVTALLEMGLDRYALSSSLLLVAGQRLARTICRECKRPAVPADDQPRSVDFPSAEADFPVFVGAGCPGCSNSGYFGRTGLFEVMPVQADIVSAIRRGSDRLGIEQAAIDAGMTTLRDDAMAKARAGVISLEELARVMPARSV